MPVTKKFMGAAICLVLAVIIFEQADAWKIVFYSGTEYSGRRDRNILQRTSVNIKTSATESTVRGITFNGSGQSKIRIIYVAREDKNPKLKEGEDYFVSVIAGGIGYGFVTIEWEILPNPSQEPMNFEIQLINYSDLY